MDDHDIGYGKPPKSTQFKKGQSGNPSGRPKGSKNKKPFVALTKTSFEFQKMIIDMGDKSINVVKEGKTLNISQLEAIMMQLFNKAMKGHLGAAKLLLEYTQKSMNDLEDASIRAHHSTKATRDSERRKIFTPSPKPDTYGAFLENKHYLYSRNFGLRELFGEDAYPQTTPEEPLGEQDWLQFNRDLQKKYKELGDTPMESASFFTHSFYEL